MNVILIHQHFALVYPPVLRAENKQLSVLSRPLAGKVQRLSNGQHHLPPPEERLPFEFQGGE